MSNPKVKIIGIKNLSNAHYKLDKVEFEYQTNKGSWQTQCRECYDRGDGAAILLYNPAKKTVILIKQFRMPSYLNGNATGMMIEVCAGLLDENNPEACIIKEVEEETGFKMFGVLRIRLCHDAPQV